jgi:hypothetical protein
MGMPAFSETIYVGKRAVGTDARYSRKIPKFGYIGCYARFKS